MTAFYFLSNFPDKLQRMKRLFILLGILMTGLVSQSQNLSRVTLTQTGEIEKLGFGMRENVILNVSKDGKVLDWGIDRYAGRGFETKPGLLDPYGGRVEYYNESENEAFRGKVRSIGGIIITYYASFDREEWAGKVKAIGPNKFEYYLNTDNEAFRGLMKKAGAQNLVWYSTYDNDAFKGKIKSIGSTPINFYSSFEDEGFRGKLKAIGSAQYIYHSSHDLRDVRGRLKSGQMLQVINGVKYHVKF